MPYLLDDLVIDRVDLVDEGSCSAAFIELYKRKEQSSLMDVKEIISKMKPEHASVIEEAINKANDALADAIAKHDETLEELAEAKEDLAEAKADLENLQAEGGCTAGSDCGAEKGCKAEKVCNTGASDEEELLKSMPEAAREYLIKMKQQKEVAEEELRKAKEAEKEAEAIAKAKELKAIPVEQDKLVGIIKRADTEVIDLLEAVNTAIEGTVLDEVGKSHTSSSSACGDAWSKIEARADEIVKRDNISKAKAISKVIKEQPDLYKEYLQGGAN